MADEPIIGQGPVAFSFKIIQSSPGSFMLLVFLPIQVISREIPSLSIGLPPDGMNILSPFKERFEDCTLILDRLCFFYQFASNLYIRKYMAS